MFNREAGLALVLVLQAILLNGCDAAVTMRNMGGQMSDYQRQSASSEQYSKSQMESESGSSSQYGASEMVAGGGAMGGMSSARSMGGQMSDYQRQSASSEQYSKSQMESESGSSSQYGASQIAAAGSSMGGIASGGSGFANGGQQMVRSQEVTTTTTTTTTTTVRAVDYIQTNFQEVGSKSMGYNDAKDEQILKSFVQKDNGCFLPTILKEPCNKKLICAELGLNVDVDVGSILKYFTTATYLKEKKVHKAALALKRCKVNTNGYHRSLLPRIDVLNYIGTQFTNSKSNSHEMMKEWHNFVRSNNGLYFQSFFGDDQLWRELAGQIGYSCNNAEDFRVYLLRNRFRKEKKTCKIAKCMRSLRKKHCGGKCNAKPKHIKKSPGGGRPGGCGGKPGGCGGKPGGCGKIGCGAGIRVGGGCGRGCRGKCGKC